MVLTNHNRIITVGLMYTASAGVGATAMLAAAGHNTIACITLVTVITVTAVTRLAPEWFWHRALNRPARHLYRIYQLTGGKAADTERLVRLVLEGERNVLTARAAASGDAGNHQAP